MDSSGRPLFETARRITVLTTTVPEPEVIQPLPELPEKPIVLEIKEALLPPPTPPPPVIPPVPFQYTGYARDSADRMIAFIETTGGAGVPAGHYNLRESEIFMGRFRLTKVSTDSVEIEDMERSENSSDRKRTVSINALIASRKAP
jgi:hypothetical protein